MRTSSLAPALLALACSSSGALQEDAGGDAGAEAGDTAADATGVDGSGGSFDTGPVIQPAAWWKLEADLELVSGAPSADASTLRIVSLDADLTERCAATAPVDRVTVLSPPEDALLTWWQVVPGDWTGGCIDAGLPVPVGALQLGVGEMHPEIVAVADTIAAVSGDAAALNGAYARLSTGGDLYVFGVAGPEAAYAGDGEPATDAPLADGLWRVSPAYAFTADSDW